MARTSPVPRFVLWANVLTTTLLRVGVPLVGPGGAPMYLITVPGRKSGQPRTTPIAILNQEGRRYVFTPYGVVDWVRNLRVAGGASLTRARRTEWVRATELPAVETSLMLKKFLASGNPIGRFFHIPADASDGEFEQAALSHPVFLLERK